MNILILGGSGFLSGTLAAEAMQQGHQVWSVTRGHRQSVPGTTSIVADRKERAAFRRAIEALGIRWDLAVDCIGFEAADALQDIEVLGPLVNQLVFVSTDFVIEPSSRLFPQSEAVVAYSTLPYGDGKRQCELVFEAAGSGQLHWTIIRPCHIYGPGSLLGCLPNHGRDENLLGKLRAEESLQLVGGGHFLQQPIFAADLAQLILSCAGNKNTRGQTYMAAGPDIVESRRYYEIIAQILGVPLTIQEVSVQAHLAAHPGAEPFLCHRIYDLSKLKAHGLAAPSTPLQTGLALHVHSLLKRESEKFAP